MSDLVVSWAEGTADHEGLVREARSVALLVTGLCMEGLFSVCQR